MYIKSRPSAFPITGSHSMDVMKQFYQMQELQTGYQIINLFLQINDPQQPPQEELMQALGLVAFVVFVVVFTGLNYRLLIVGGGFLFFLRPSIVVLQFGFNILKLLLWLISLYQNFLPSLGSTFYGIVAHFVIKFVCNFFHVLNNATVHPSLVAFFCEICIFYEYLSPIFWGRVAFTIAGWVLTKL